MTEQYIEELLRKYAQGVATTHEVEQLMSWYHSSSIDDVEWSISNDNEKQELSRRMLDRLVKAVVPQRKPVIAMGWFKVAAVLIPCIGLVLLFLLLRTSAKEYITITNPSGQIQLVSLPDGSQVWLNASTKLHYQKSFRKNREIVLDGEAFFDVHRDLDHPFTINGGDVTTTVLGTSFNVKAYQSDTVTLITVVTGRVRVDNSSTSLATLTPSTQLEFNKVQRKATTALVDTSGALAWRKGKLVFEGKSLGDISRTIEHWYGVRIIFKNPTMKNCRYYMSFNNTISLETLLSTMSEITGTTYVIDRSKNVVELSGEGCQ